MLPVLFGFLILCLKPFLYTRADGGRGGGEGGRHRRKGGGKGKMEERKKGGMEAGAGVGEGPLDLQSLKPEPAASTPGRRKEPPALLHR